MVTTNAWTLGVPLILTIDPLSALAEGHDFPRQRYRPFVRLSAQGPSAYKPRTLTPRPQRQHRLSAFHPPAPSRTLQALAHQRFTCGFDDARSNRYVMRPEGCIAHPGALRTTRRERLMNRLTTGIARAPAP